MTEIAITALLSGIVGLVIGWTGIAGFLLPVLFMDYNGMGSAQSMFLAFFCFLAGGILGTLNYKKEGLLEVQSIKALPISSFIGAAIGAMFNTVFKESTMKLVLYAVVFVSGISIFLRPFLKSNAEWKENGKRDAITGFSVALLCAFTGAGGPVLLSPLLILQGMEAKKAVAVSLFISIFIALPSMIVYAFRTEAFRIEIILPVLILHSIGVYAASKHSKFINGEILKKGIAIFSIIFALIMFIRSFQIYGI